MHSHGQQLDAWRLIFLVPLSYAWPLGCGMKAERNYSCVLKRAKSHSSELEYTDQPFSGDQNIWLSD
jgi:hypothetical protein